MSGLSRSDIDEIMRLVEHSNFDELKLEIGDIKIELRRAGTAPAPSSPPSTDSPAAAHTPPPTPGGAPASPAVSPGHGHVDSPTHGGVDVPAPQLGIFYHAPRPGEPPFVAVGDEVHPDTVIGIIEVMKLMNTVTAGISGTVTEVVAPNGQGVKQGDTLLRIRPF